ncbi:hypothetical protein [Streptomyces canus]|uniref:hypothetical protein n=1 Tax=Streptomyces canus TaxID=58343 RepID=UPI00286F975A|nr:hypothetical protein [Streptomyces canus]
MDLRPDGLYQHEPASEGQLFPWSRIMTDIRITWGKYSWNSLSRGRYTLKGMIAGRSGGWMHMTPRHPYEDHQLRWLGDAVAHLIGGKNRWITSRALRLTAAEAVTVAGPAGR